MLLGTIFQFQWMMKVSFPNSKRTKFLYDLAEDRVPAGVLISHNVNKGYFTCPWEKWHKFSSSRHLDSPLSLVPCRREVLQILVMPKTLCQPSSYMCHISARYFSWRHTLSATAYYFPLLQIFVVNHVLLSMERLSQSVTTNPRHWRSDAEIYWLQRLQG